ncbi:MAG: hypothetical protein Ta2E_11220 [Mycoplasmoidaceae bacterium]|nr:MAG: hypothetical protein Ta2E_11220 [Mycoplasmoidaceae bacterium]
MVWSLLYDWLSKIEFGRLTKTNWIGTGSTTLKNKEENNWSCWIECTWIEEGTEEGIEGIWIGKSLAKGLEGIWKDKELKIKKILCLYC